MRKVKRGILLTLCVLIAGVAAATLRVAHAKFTPQTQQAIYELHGQDGGAMMPCFIKVRSAEVIDSLRRLGVTVNCKFGNILTAQVPKESMESVGKLAHVKTVQAAQSMSLCNDASRELIRTDEIAYGSHFDKPYTGKGVVLGMIDVGIDYNHIEFRDSEGKSRVKGVYMPCDNSGQSPVIDGEKLPGSAYSTAEEISQLTTDNRAMSHGTHTTTTAAGSYSGNNYYGVATESDLVLCGMPEDSLTDVNIANSLAYIFNYAEMAQKPVVVNMSLASNVGPRDGSSMLCQVIESLTGEGKICVLSIGNDGRYRLKTQKYFGQQTDVLSHFLENLYDLYSLKGEVDVWSDNEKPFEVQMVLYDKRERRIVYELPCYKSQAGEETLVKVNCADDAFLRNLCEGEIGFSSGIGENGKMELYTNFDIKYTCSKEESRNYYFGLRYIATVGTTLTGWSNIGTQLVSNGVAGWTEGTPNGAISDMATGKGAISVGAYCSKTSVPQIEGVGAYDAYNLGDIAGFSGYGYDLNGDAHPMIVAPGYAVVSAMSRYDENNATNVGFMSLQEEIGGETYLWGAMYGTSQSAPLVTGTIALWLEADDSLDADDVKHILQETAIRDEHITLSNELRWGYGKIDAFKGLQYIITGSGVDENAMNKLWHLSMNNGELMVTSPIDGNISIGVYDLSGREVCQGKCEIEGGRGVAGFGQRLMQGIYIVRLSIKGENRSFKMIIKN